MYSLIILSFIFLLYVERDNSLSVLIQWGLGWCLHNLFMMYLQKMTFQTIVIKVIMNYFSTLFLYSIIIPRFMEIFHVNQLLSILALSSLSERENVTLCINDVYSMTNSLRTGKFQTSSFSWWWTTNFRLWDINVCC